MYKLHTVSCYIRDEFNCTQWRIQGRHGGHDPPFLPNRQSAAPAGTQEVFATYHKYDAN